MGLLGSKTDVELAVEQSTVTAGDVVTVTARLGDLDRKVQGARAELIYRNTYKQDSVDSDGDRTTSKVTSDVVAAAHQIDTSAGSPGEVSVDLRVPADAPGSADGSVEWQARVIVDRRRGRDARAEQPLTVLAPAEPLASWADGPAQASNCPMTLDVDARTVRPGQTLHGTLSITPNEPIKARGVRVQLCRERRDPDQNVDRDDSVRAALSAKSDLPAGVTQTFPFDIVLPVDASPSFRAQHNEQHWYVEGIVDVARASDPKARLEIVVHTA